MLLIDALHLGLDRHSAAHCIAGFSRAMGSHADPPASFTFELSDPGLWAKRARLDFIVPFYGSLRVPLFVGGFVGKPKGTPKKHTHTHTQQGFGLGLARLAPSSYSGLP